MHIVISSSELLISEVRALRKNHMIVSLIAQEQGQEKKLAILNTGLVNSYNATLALKNKA